MLLSYIHASLFRSRTGTAVLTLLYIIYGSLWIHWLRALAKDPDPNKMCRDVQPALRKTLTVLAWIGAIVVILMLIMLITTVVVLPPFMLWMVALPGSFLLAFIVTLYTAQLMYLYRVEHSGCRLGEETNSTKRNTLVIFATFIISFGIFGLFSAILAPTNAFSPNPTTVLSTNDREELLKNLRALLAQTNTGDEVSADDAVEGGDGTDRTADGG